ncbi:MAG TPA: acyltransferase [Sphingomonas sp.]|uniref:acyltransferase family protein n=1 Tax=Sphingomonas sp. TaxID=28214 RepID=UPI002BD18F7D|nr:acyltransferase [Sphingomonas sp.]HMI18575.1 acyltransferase [Sphingomonas sp.]
MTVSQDAPSAGHLRRADENPDAAAFGANPETHKLDSYPGLDWLRFALASTVALAHEGVPFPGPISAGLAVDIFLALSGWLIGGILIATPVAGLPRFFFNRATRIWIPYAVAILLVYGLAVAKEGAGLNWLKYLFYDVTFTHYTFTTFPRALMEMPLGGTGNHFWSLSIEEQFYLLAPIVMLTLPFGKKLWLWLVLSALLVGFEVRAAPIALGVAAAITQRDYGAWQAKRVAHWLLVALTAILLAAMWRYDVTPLHALFSIGVVLSLAFIGPRARIGLFFGAISYPLYLNHWIGAFAMHVVAKVTGPLPAVIAVAIAYGGAVLVGIASWFFVDRLVMKRRAGWYSPARGRALGGIAYALVGIGLIGGTVIYLNGG